MAVVGHGPITSLILNSGYFLGVFGRNLGAKPGDLENFRSWTSLRESIPSNTTKIKGNLIVKKYF